ncbi:hypothetical protein MKEN_00805800 [Mycena kentingensis (nom. inval.)]|nr:hypothetical protein MKEN_00805800 [Mycena kentingensis (nom. inval.)]
MGFSTTVSMALGMIVGWGILSPISKLSGWAPGPVGDMTNGARGWILWTSLAIMCSDSLVSLMKDSKPVEIVVDVDESKPLDMYRRPRTPAGFHQQLPAFGRTWSVQTPPTMAYVVVGPVVRGKFDVEKSLALGVPVNRRSWLTDGKSIVVKVKEGDEVVERVVKPEDCIGSSELLGHRSRQRSRFFLDVPSPEYIPSLVSSFQTSPFYAKFRSWLPEDMAKYTVRPVFHLCGAGVLEDARYVEFMNGFPATTQYIISSRVYGRDTVTFTTASFNQLPANGERVLLLNADIAMGDTGVRRALLRALSAEFGSGTYHAGNVAFVGTHQHSGVGGYLENLLPQLTALGISNQSFNAIVDGSVLATRRAHASLAPGTLSLGAGRVEQGSRNRSPTAYLANPAAERAKYASNGGENGGQEWNMSVLRFDSSTNKVDGRGFLSFFAVHGTSVYENNTLFSGDNKGMAACLYETFVEPNAMPGNTACVAGETVRAKLISERILGEDAHVVVAGPANTYSHYIATPEEYTVQRYEGASTLYGPHTLDAYLDRYARLVPFLADGDLDAAGTYRIRYFGDSKAAFGGKITLFEGVSGEFHDCAWNASCIGTFFCPWVYTAELDKLLVEIYIDFVFLAVVRKAPKGELTGSLERAQMLVMQKCAAAQRRLQGRTELAAPTQVDIFDHGDSDSEASESEDEAIPTARAAAPKKSAWKPQVLPPDDHGRRLFCERLRATVQHFFWDENSCPGLEYYLLEDTRVLKYVSLHPLLATAWLPAIHESGLGLSLHQLTKAASPARRQRADVALSWRVHDWEIAFGAILQRFMDADTMSKATTGVESPKAVPNNVQKFKPKELLLYLGRNINLMALTANPLAALTFAGQDHFAHHWDAWLKETMREAPGIPFDETWDPFAMYRDIVRNPLFRQDDRLRSLGCHDDFIHILQLTSKFRDNSDTIHKETFSHPTLFTMGELDELAALFAPFAIGHDPASESSAAPKATFEDAKRARSDSVQDPAEHFAKRIKTHARNIALAAQTHLGQAPAATTSNKPERQSTSSPFCARDDATGRTVYVAPDTQAHDGGFDAPAGLTGCSICTHLRPREHCLRILYVDSHDVAHLNGCAVTEAPIHDQLPSLKKDIEVKYVHPQDLPPLETIRGRPEILLGRGCGTDTTLIVDRQTLHLASFPGFYFAVILILLGWRYTIQCL